LTKRCPAWTVVGWWSAAPTLTWPRCCCGCYEPKPWQRCWSVTSAAAEVAVKGLPDRVPLVRDDAGGVLVGLGVVRPLDGVAYCDAELVLRGRASRLEVLPDRELGLMVRVVRRGLPGRRVRCAAGRAVQLGCHPTDVWRDGVVHRTTDRWTWYRHTEDWQLARIIG
jgi:hypothetical protein